LSSYLPEDERIVTIEDAAELHLQQSHVVRMETRPPNIEGAGAIHIRQLVVNALRMRPDRIILGEVRAEEALDMLQAMNTGHDGSLTTIHANAPRDGLGRLEVMVGMANANMGVRSIRQQIAAAVQLFVQTSRFSDGTRRVTHITEVIGMEQDTILLQDIFLFEKTGINASGKVTGRFRPTGVRPRFYERPASIRDHPAHADLSDRSGGQLITACANYGGQERLDTCGQAHSLERLQQAWDVRTDRAPAIQEEAELDRDHAERKLALKQRGPPRRGGQYGGCEPPQPTFFPAGSGHIVTANGR